FRRFAGRVGDSDLSGDFQIDTSQARSKTVADLSSTRFRYADLGGFIGLPPLKPTTEAQQTEARRRAASPRVLPEKAFGLGALRMHDDDVKFHGKALSVGDTPLDDVVSHLKLQDGLMRFEPLDFGIGGGHAVTNVTLDLNRETPEVQGQVEVRRVELERLYP